MSRIMVLATILCLLAPNALGQRSEGQVKASFTRVSMWRSHPGTITPEDQPWCRSEGPGSSDADDAKNNQGFSHYGPCPGVAYSTRPRPGFVVDCMLVSADGYYHREHAIRDAVGRPNNIRASEAENSLTPLEMKALKLTNTKASEGRLTPAELDALSSVVGRQQFNAAGSPSVTARLKRWPDMTPYKDRILSVGVWRPDDIRYQKLTFINEARDPFNAVLQPLLQWWDTTAAPKRPAAKKVAPNNCTRFVSGTR